MECATHANIKYTRQVITLQKHLIKYLTLKNFHKSYLGIYTVKSAETGKKFYQSPELG